MFFVRAERRRAKCGFTADLATRIRCLWHSPAPLARAGYRQVRRSHRRAYKRERKRDPGVGTEMYALVRANRSAPADHRKRHTSQDRIRTRRKSCCQWQPPLAVALGGWREIEWRCCQWCTWGGLLPFLARMRDFRLCNRRSRRRNQAGCMGTPRAFPPPLPTCKQPGSARLASVARLSLRSSVSCSYDFAHLYPEQRRMM